MQGAGIMVENIHRAQELDRRFVELMGIGDDVFEISIVV